MKTAKIFRDEKRNVSLTTYILDKSPEMPQCDKRPAILICPGGAYRFCSDREAEPVAMAFMAEGYNAFVLRYGVNEESVFPKPLEDAEWALDLIRANSEEYGVCEDKIAVIGFSAGGHLAGSLATMGKTRPNAAILAYPCVLYDEHMREVLYAPVPSLEQQVDDKTPPCYIFATSEDTCVPVENALEFSLALHKKQIPFELHVFEKGGHGLSLAKPVTGGVNKDFAQWVPMCVNWLEKHF